MTKSPAIACRSGIIRQLRRESNGQDDRLWMVRASVGEEVPVARHRHIDDVAVNATLTLGSPPHIRA